MTHLYTNPSADQHTSASQGTQAQSELPEQTITTALWGLLWQLLPQRPSAGLGLAPGRQERPLLIAPKDTINKQHLTPALSVNRTVCRLRHGSREDPHESGLRLLRLLARVPVQQQNQHRSLC